MTTAYHHGRREDVSACVSDFSPITNILCILKCKYHKDPGLLSSLTPIRFRLKLESVLSQIQQLGSSGPQLLHIDFTQHLSFFGTGVVPLTSIYVIIYICIYIC